VTTERGRPTYRLEDLWQALDEGRYVFHRPARDGFTALGWTERDAVECLHGLTTAGFRKSMPGRHIRGWHDVYRMVWQRIHPLLPQQRGRVRDRGDEARRRRRYLAVGRGG